MGFIFTVYHVVQLPTYCTDTVWIATVSGWTAYFSLGSANDAQSAFFRLKPIPFILFSSSIRSPNECLLKSFALTRDGWLPILLPKGHPHFVQLSMRKGNSVLENVKKK